MSSKQNDLTNENSSEERNRREFLVAGLGVTAAASFLPLGASGAHAQQEPSGKSPSPVKSPTKTEQELIDLSKNKWRWMSERNVDSLGALFHDEAVFVHMGATMSRKQELDTIKSGNIQYKKAEIRDTSVRIIDTTAILLSTIRLVAVVGGNEVTNPFVVTEVYVQQRVHGS